MNDLNFFKGLKMQTSRNIMGTISFTHKFPKMRKEQEFIVYPISKDTGTETMYIQSSTRFGEMDIKSGSGFISDSHANGANSIRLMLDKARGKAVPFTMDTNDLETLLNAVRETAGALVGRSLVLSDNSEAGNI